MRIVKALATMWLITGMLGVAARGDEAKPRLNFLFILIDDLGYGDLSCFGGTKVQTPAIDGLAREGIRFTHFYVNSPVCSPSRVAFTTGQYPARWRITSYLDSREHDRERGIADWLPTAAPSLAKFLSQAGYYTAHVGKWHMGGQRDVGDSPLITEYGFATSLTNFEGLGERALPKFEPMANGKPLRHVPTEMNAKLGGPIHWIDRHKVTEFFVDRALREMKTAGDKNKPFYINLWLDDVHAPVQAPPGLCGDGSPKDHYLGVMKEMDRQLGRVFDFIRKDSRLRDNTVILLTSDNGPLEGLGSTGGLRGCKANLYEGGIRSPLIVWFGGIPKAALGSTNGTTILAGIDFPPSILALACVPSPAGVAFDGLNMTDALTGRTSPRRDHAIMWVRPPDRPGPNGEWPDLAIRDGDWKLLINRDGSRPQLFNIPNDPDESDNLADDHPERVRQFGDKVVGWLKAVKG